MSQQSIVILAIAAAGTALFLAIRALLRRALRLREERARKATERGWTYVQAGKYGSGYSVEGSAEGFSWRLELRAGQKGHVSAEWRCEALGSGGPVVVVMDPSAAALFKSPVAQKVARWGLRMVPQGDSRSASLERLLDGHVEVDTGDEAFRKAFTVLTTDEGTARRLLSGEARAALVEWQAATSRGAGGRSLTVNWSDSGLSLHWSAGLEDPEAMARFADAGILLGRSAKGHW